MMRITGLLWSGKLQSFMAFSATPLKSSLLIGDPVSTALSAGRYFMVSGKLQQTFLAPFMAILLASPGVISDSWMMAGTWQCFAASTTGTETKPPLENTTSGLSFFMRLTA